MVRSHYELDLRAKARTPKTDQEYRDFVEHPETEFFEALTIAEIYLDSETSKVMHEVLGAVRQTQGTFRGTSGGGENKTRA